MKNSQLPDFTIIRCDDKAALVDPESKVCLIVSKRIADTLNLKETNDKYVISDGDTSVQYEL